MTYPKRPRRLMQDLNPEYIKGFPFSDSLDEEGYPGPLLKGIRNLLNTCGMFRVLTEEDMRVFLTRLVILHRREDAVKELEKLEDPLAFAFDDDKTKVTLGDIFRHNGIETWNYAHNYIDYDGFRYILALAWSGGWRSNTRYELANPSAQLVEEAEKFAEKALELAPVEIFADNELLREKLEELRLRKEAIDSIPEFELEKIPVEIRNQCMQIMFTNEFSLEMIEYLREFPEDSPSFFEDEKKYMYLAWLYANGLICDDRDMSFPVEGVDLDVEKYSTYDIELGELGLDHTIKEFNIAATIPLLKGQLYK